MQCNKTGILLSGGMDSMALAYWKRPDMAFTIDYGQNCAEAEIKASSFVAERLGMEHHIIKVDCGALGSGDLSSRATLPGAPTTEWWPYRNQLLVTLACMKGLSVGLKTLYVGSILTDGQRHQDGTEEFYKRLSNLMEFQEGAIQVETPAIGMTTYDLITHSGMPKEWLLWSHSCHTSNIPCMQCSGCQKNYAVRHHFGLG